MATKTYKLRLDFKLLDQLHQRDPEEYPHNAADVHRWLWNTHVAFNTGVDYLATWLLRMYRGAGVWRQRTDGIWGDWRHVLTHADLIDARRKVVNEPDRYALIENKTLMDGFLAAGKSESEAVSLMECCRTIVLDRGVLDAERGDAPMDRSALDLLTLIDSEAKGIRSRAATKSGGAKKTSGKRPAWLLQRAVQEAAADANSWGDFMSILREREEFRSAKKDGEKRIAALRQKYGSDDWPTAKAAILEFERREIGKLAAAAQSLDDFSERINSCARIDGKAAEKLVRRLQKQGAMADWPSAQEAIQDEYGLPSWQVLKSKAERRLSESKTSGALAAYRTLLAQRCLPLPGFHRPATFLHLNGALAQWNYTMWDMAGQRVRSHLGWVRRRAGERLLWEKRKKLFEDGGWIRRRREASNVKDSDLTPDDIVFSPPADEGDFDKQAGHGHRAWLAELQTYETAEMPKHLEGVAFVAGGAQGLTARTIKGWEKIRDRWHDRLKKDQSAMQSDLLGIVNDLRRRKPREFGDQRIFEWLADPNRRWLWDASDAGIDNDCGRSDRDCVSAFVSYNESFADRPESITFTQSHATLHPVWPFFGEKSSAVGYTMMRQQMTDKESFLVLSLAQVLAREGDGSYRAVDGVRIPLRAYDDFSRSFDLPANQEFTAKQQIKFCDDLLAGCPRPGTLSGMKILWDRGALVRAQAQTHEVSPSDEKSQRARPPFLPPTSRVYVAFSCDAGEVSPPAWLTTSVGKLSTLKKPRDGMTEVFFLSRKTCEDRGSPRHPGERWWPREAVENGLCVRGTDLGFRTSSAGAWWRLSFKKVQGQVCWRVGQCAEDAQIAVYAVLEHQMPVSLPGDAEEVPEKEKDLRDRLRSLRTRLNLNNMLLRVSRLLTLDELSRSVPTKRVRNRQGVERPDGRKWETTVQPLSAQEIQENCRKAAEQLLVWSTKDSMIDSLRSVGFDGPIWQWLAAQDGTLAAVAAAVPVTEVPSEKEARQNNIDRRSLVVKRQEEDAIFARLVYQHRAALANAIASGYDSEQRRRATRGLWADLDRALLRDISYGDKGSTDGVNSPNPKGLLPLLRKPPVTKHHDRKDEKNNLPHGRTHRGGLSMARLNFLDEVKSLVRKWSCRSRWPGDVRRLAEDAKFDRQDTEHLDHLREHRAKLIAHADVAQALGFEQDLRRGVWRFPASNGAATWHRPERCHFYVAENGELHQTAAPEGASEADYEIGGYHVKMTREQAAKWNAGELFCGIAPASAACALLEADKQRDSAHSNTMCGAEILLVGSTGLRRTISLADAMADPTICSQLEGERATPIAARPHRSHATAHILVYEDLSRYRMRADRPKNENAGLARWSHRRILKYAQHIGGLFGIPVATVSAAYSSRFCCRCGAPGCRAVQFDPSWLDQSWIHRIMDSTDIRDMAMKGVARFVENCLNADPNAFADRAIWPWVLKDGGTHFVCANRDCEVNRLPVNADENAAANIGLWFLRGIDDFKVKIDGTRKPSRPLRYTAVTRFEHIADGDPTYWQAESAATAGRQRLKREQIEEEAEPSEDEGAGTWLFRDPSGKALPASRWYEPKVFWGEVARYSASGIKAANASRWSDLAD